MTAEFGSDFPDLDAVEAHIGDGLSFRAGGGIAAELVLTPTNNGDGTFSIALSAPLKVALSGNQVDSTDVSGTVVGTLTMRENGSETNGFTFSLLSTGDDTSFEIVGDELRTASAMTNVVYWLTIRGTNAVSGRSADTDHTIDVTFPVGPHDWTGAVDGDWHNPYNWSARSRPTYYSYDPPPPLSGRRQESEFGSMRPYRPIRCRRIIFPPSICIPLLLTCCMVR